MSIAQQSLRTCQMERQPASWPGQTCNQRLSVRGNEVETDGVTIRFGRSTHVLWICRYAVLSYIAAGPEPRWLLGDQFLNGFADWFIYNVFVSLACSDSPEPRFVCSSSSSTSTPVQKVLHFSINWINRRRSQRGKGVKRSEAERRRAGDFIDSPSIA